MTSSSHGSQTDTPEKVGATATILPPPHEQDELDYETLPTTSVKVQLLAGAIAGIAEHTIIYPIDAIKVKSRPSSGLFFCLKGVFECVADEGTSRRECR